MTLCGGRPLGGSNTLSCFSKIRCTSIGMASSPVFPKSFIVAARNSTNTPEHHFLSVLNIAFNDIPVRRNAGSPLNVTVLYPILIYISNLFQSTSIRPTLPSHCIPKTTSVLPNSIGKKLSTIVSSCNVKTTSRHIPFP